MKDKRHWFVRENSSKRKKLTFRFSRAQWKFLDFNKGVEASLDAEFGPENKVKIRFTERRHLTR
jgi:hypothetical protein